MNQTINKISYTYNYIIKTNKIKSLLIVNNTKLIYKICLVNLKQNPQCRGL